MRFGGFPLCWISLFWDLPSLFPTALAALNSVLKYYKPETAFLPEASLPCATWTGKRHLGKNDKNAEYHPICSFQSLTASGCLTLPSNSCFLVFCPEFMCNCYLCKGQSVTIHSTSNTKTLAVSLCCKERRWWLKILKGCQHIYAPKLTLDWESANFFRNSQVVNISGFVGPSTATQLYY